MDDRKEFVDEMREESRAERELHAMSAIVEGECSLDRLAQMFDWDGFEFPADDILASALRAESEEDPGDYEAVRGMASEFIEDAIAEYLAPIDPHMTENGIEGPR